MNAERTRPVLRCAGLQRELGLSARREQVLGVKIEVDTRPPAGAVCTTSMVRRHLTLNLHHHDQASLLARMMHAILLRPCAKGRDWHDPNLRLLNSALQLSAENLQGVLERRRAQAGG